METHATYARVIFTMAAKADSMEFLTMLPGVAVPYRCAIA